MLLQFTDDNNGFEVIGTNYHCVRKVYMPDDSYNAYMKVEFEGEEKELFLGIVELTKKEGIYYIREYGTNEKHDDIDVFSNMAEKTYHAYVKDAKESYENAMNYAHQILSQMNVSI